MQAKDAVIFWSPRQDEIRDVTGDTWGSVKVGHRPQSPDEAEAYKEYFYSRGADGLGWVEMQPAERLNIILLTYINMVVDGGISPLHAHEALCEIDEYRKAARAYVSLPHRYENEPDDEEWAKE